MSPVEAVYDDPVTRMRKQNICQLEGSRSFVIELSDKEPYISPLEIMTDEQLWNHIDHSLAQAKAGIGREADEVIDDLLKEVAV